MFAGELKKQKALFAIADTVALAVAAAAAVSLHDPAGSTETRIASTDPFLVAASAIVAVLLWVGVFRAFDLYQIRNGGLKETKAVVKACTAAAALILIGGFVVHVEISRIIMGIFYLISIPTVIATRMLLRALIRRFYSSPRIAIPIVIVGFNSIAHYLCDRIVEELTQYEPIGFLDAGSIGREYHDRPVLGDPERLAELRDANPGLEAAIALPDASLDEQARMVNLCEKFRVRWWMVPWVYRSAATGLRLDTVGIIPVVGPRGSNIEGLNYLIKRAFDITCASLLLMVALPVIGVAAVAILITDGTPILFRQERIGVHGRRFKMLKLRTMGNTAADGVHREYVQRWINNGHDGAANGNGTHKKVFKLFADPRVTRVGRILRRFSVDEFPQLFNVVRGDMSLIGPRPCLPYELELYQDWHRRRLEGLPGITGLWQVSGRNHLSFDDMVRLDVQYLEDWSLATDVRILFQTIPVLLRGEGL
jgi:exopolysaccharide biosynthesis polyprenyl glycosylphosphotransferase